MAKEEQTVHTKHERSKGTQLHSTRELDPRQQLRSILNGFNQ